MRILQCNTADYPALVAIWERSVRATHHFLTESDIAEIRDALVPAYFPHVNLYAAFESTIPVGFIGLCRESIEMLFIDSDRFGQGIGSALIEFAKQRGAVKVDVNEQNPSALKFYLSKGFHIVGRTSTDEAGRPYPILHLSLQPERNLAVQEPSGLYSES